MPDWGRLDATNFKESPMKMATLNWLKKTYYSVNLHQNHEH